MVKVHLDVDEFWPYYYETDSDSRFKEATIEMSDSERMEMRRILEEFHNLQLKLKRRAADAKLRSEKV